MPQDRADSRRSLIARTSPRATFAELVGAALREVGLRPTPMATAYLIELLDERVRSPEPPEPEPALTEALIAAGLAEGAERIARLRRLGDRTLFVAGFFGESLRRGVMSPGYCGEVGRSAYASLSAALASALVERTWSRLFEELADRFRDFTDVLAQVSDRACPRGSGIPLGLYRRYVETGSEVDRRRLLRCGQNLPRLVGPERRQ